MNQRGFTLLEMMLVVLLIGSAAILVLMSFPATQQKNMQQLRERLQTQLDLALDASQQDGIVLGLQIRPQGWEFKLLQHQKSEYSSLETGSNIWREYVWRPWQPRRTALGGKLPQEINLELQLQYLEQWPPASSQEATPDILLLPGGEVTPFTLLFRRADSNAVVGLKVDANGVIDVFEDEVER